jgi:hypothetical protein
LFTTLERTKASLPLSGPMGKWFSSFMVLLPFQILNHQHFSLVWAFEMVTLYNQFCVIFISTLFE